MNGVYLFGPPGVGKTTVMNSLLRDFVRLPPERSGRLALEPMCDADGAFQGVHLGRTRPLHGGTDALPYDVVADACRWASTTTVATLYGEGARLANLRFAEACGTGVLWVCLSAPPHVLDARCAARGTTQSASWRKGAASAARSLCDALVSSGHRVRQYDAVEEPHVTAAAVRALMAEQASTETR